MGAGTLIWGFDVSGHQGTYVDFERLPLRGGSRGPSRLRLGPLQPRPRHVPVAHGAGRSQDGGPAGISGPC